MFLITKQKDSVPILTKAQDCLMIRGIRWLWPVQGIRWLDGCGQSRD